MRQFTPFGMLLALLMIVLLPLFFGQLMVSALVKLHLSRSAAIELALAIIVGGLINIPVRRIVRNDTMPSNPLAVYGLSAAVPQLMRARRETIIAVNVGGCVIPTLVAIYELGYITVTGAPVLSALVVACAANTLACYAVAEPVKGVGIVMPGFVSPIIAAVIAMFMAPEAAAPVAFIAGVVGPLVGAGTFDGIVLSGIVAAYLA